MFASSSLLLEVISQPFKRSQLGLFHGKMKQYGNNNPFSKKKTRRTWLPNVQSKRLPSDLLGKTFKLKVTTRALRTIKKYGGLDNYLLKSDPKILGQEGMRLRMLLREAQEKKLQEMRGPTELEKLRTLVNSASARAELARTLKSGNFK